MKNIKKHGRIRCGSITCCNTSDFCLCPDPQENQMNIVFSGQELKILSEFNFDKFDGVGSGPMVIKYIINQFLTNNKGNK